MKRAEGELINPCDLTGDPYSAQLTAGVKGQATSQMGCMCVCVCVCSLDEGEDSIYPSISMNKCIN